MCGLSRSQYRGRRTEGRVSSTGKASVQWMFPETNVGPMHHFEGWSLACIFDCDDYAGTSGGIGDACISLSNNLTLIQGHRVCDVEDSTGVAKYVRP